MISILLFFSPPLATYCGGIARCVDITIPASSRFAVIFGVLAGMFFIRLARWVLDILP